MRQPIKRGGVTTPAPRIHFQTQTKTDRKSIAILACKYKHKCSEPCGETYPSCPYGLDNLTGVFALFGECKKTGGAA
jgi:hypothetical protein